MAGSGEILGDRAVAGQSTDCSRPVAGGDTCGSISIIVNGDREGSAVLSGVDPVDHHGDVKFVQPLADDGDAQKAPGIIDGEVDGLGGDLLGRHGEVALVLPASIVHYDDESAVLDLFQGLFHAG